MVCLCKIFHHSSNLTCDIQAISKDSEAIYCTWPCSLPNREGTVIACGIWDHLLCYLGESYPYWRSDMRPNVLAQVLVVAYQTGMYSHNPISAECLEDISCQNKFYHSFWYIFGIIMVSCLVPLIVRRTKKNIVPSSNDFRSLCTHRRFTRPSSSSSWH